MDQSKSLLRILYYMGYYLDDLNILLLNKNQININEINKIRNKDNKIKINKDVLNDVYYKIALKENIIMTDYTFIQDLEIIVHDFSNHTNITTDFKDSLEYIMNEDVETLNIILLNESIISKIEFVFKCIYFNLNDISSHKIEDKIEFVTDLHKKTKEKILNHFKSYNTDKKNLDSKEFQNVIDGLMELEDKDIPLSEKIKKVKDLLDVFKGNKTKKTMIENNENNMNLDEKSIKNLNDSYDILNIVYPTEKFIDIIGLESIKTKLKSLVSLYKENIEDLQKHKIERDKGFVLYGEPGTGKTMLCKAFANEINGIFVYLSMEQFVSKRNDEMTITKLFEELYILSNTYKEKTIVLFLDELDSLRARGQSGHNNGYYDGFTNEMLYKIDSLPKNIMIIGATNNISGIDDAILRKGRLGNKYEVKNNFKKEDIIQHLTKLFTNSKMSKLNKYSKEIATMIYYMNGADIANILNKIKQNYYFHLKDNNKTKLSKLILDTIYSEKYNIADYKITDEEELITAYHEAGHALMYMSYYGTDKLHEISIYPTEKTLGFVSYKFEKVNVTKEDLKQMTLISLAGRYAEKLITNNISTGAISDLEKANKHIDEIISKFGMGNVSNLNKNKNNLSDYMLTKIDQEHEELLSLYSKQTEDFIEKNKEIIEILAKDLVKEKVLIDKFVKYIDLLNS